MALNGILHCAGEGHCGTAAAGGNDHAVGGDALGHVPVVFIVDDGRERSVVFTSLVADVCFHHNVVGRNHAIHFREELQLVLDIQHGGFRSPLQGNVSFSQHNVVLKAVLVLFGAFTDEPYHIVVVSDKFLVERLIELYRCYGVARNGHHAPLRLLVVEDVALSVYIELDREVAQVVTALVVERGPDLVGLSRNERVGIDGLQRHLRPAFGLPLHVLVGQGQCVVFVGSGKHVHEVRAFVIVVGYGVGGQQLVGARLDGVGDGQLAFQFAVAVEDTECVGHDEMLPDDGAVGLHQRPVEFAEHSVGR